MAWETRPHSSGRYYTRSRKVAGRVLRFYVGGGAKGEAAAAEDAHRRAEAQTRRADRQQDGARLAALDAPIARLDTLTSAMTVAALTLAGYHRHHGGEWRKRRAG